MLSVSGLVVLGLTMVCRVSATILQNGQVKPTDYANTKIDVSSHSFTTYPANATEISYQGRWDSKYVSWWSTPGIKFGYTGQTVAISFGNWTSNGVLVAYRIGGLDWMFTNVTVGGTHMLVSPETPGSALSGPINPWTFELRVTNWAYGVQIKAVHVAAGEKLVQLPRFGRRIEFIGDSLASGMYNSYEGLSGWAYGLGNGLGNTEYSITAYPGICAADQNCWGNPRGQVHQWFYTSDTSSRATDMYGDNPEPWDFSKHSDADIVVMNIGTNDRNKANNVSSAVYKDAITKIIQGVHGKWPNAHVIIMSVWLGFFQTGNSWFPRAPDGFVDEIYQTYQYFNTNEYLRNPTIYDGLENKTWQTNKASKPFVHYFNTTGIMQHNDFNPGFHLTDVGAIKVASHLQQYIRLTFGWEFQATGPEVFHDTLYWNNEPNY